MLMRNSSKLTMYNHKAKTVKEKKNKILISDCSTKLLTYNVLSDKKVISLYIKLNSYINR